MKKKTKTDCLYLNRALIMKLFLNKTFLTEGRNRSEIKHIIRRGSRDDKQ